MTQTQSTENSYQKQATDFLQQTGTTFEAKFLKNGKYWDDDKDSRDIYEITLKRGKRSYSFNFGQSLNNSGFYYTKGRTKYKLPLTLIDKPNQQLANYIKSKIDWEFLNNGKSDVIHRPVAPTAYCVLTCLTKYDPGTFEDFCSEFGYNTDSRKAEKIYQAVKDEWQNVCALFTDAEIELLQEIQ